MRIEELYSQMRYLVLQDVGTGSVSAAAAPTASSTDPNALYRDGTRQLIGNLGVASGILIDGVDVSVLGDAFTVLNASFAAHVAAADPHTAYLRADGTRTLTGNMAVNGGVTIDGVDISAHAADVNAHHAQVHTISGSDHTGTITDAQGPQFLLTNGTRNLTGNLTVTGGITIDGVDISVLNTDFGQQKVPLTIGPATTNTVNASGQSHALDLASAYSWGGTHTFAGHVVPNVTDTSDLGTSVKLWRKGWLSELDAILFAQNTITLLGGWFIIGKGEGAIPPGADITNVATTVNFGQAMTNGQFVQFRAAGAVEYMTVGTLVSGTTYNVTRNVDGSGANAWPAGSVYLINGVSGDGRIELNAFDTPRIQIVKQGATYNAQTEVMRMGDLNGWGAYATQLFGVAIGEYGASNNKPWITIEETNGIRIGRNGLVLGQWDTAGAISIGQIAASSSNVLISAGAIKLRNNTTDVITLLATANGAGQIATFDGVVGISSAGGIWQGSGTFASPTTGLKIWNDAGTGRIAGYNAGTLQWEAATDGKLKAGTGLVTLDANGLQILVNTAVGNLRAYKFIDGSSNTIARFTAYAGTSVVAAVRTLAQTGLPSNLTLLSEAPASQLATLNVYTVVDGVASTAIYLDSTQGIQMVGNQTWLNDNTYDIGATGANRPRDLFVARNTKLNGTLDWVTDNGSDIGQAATARPRDVHIGRDLKLAGIITGAGNPLFTASSANIGIGAADGYLRAFFHAGSGNAGLGSNLYYNGSNWTFPNTAGYGGHGAALQIYPNSAFSFVKTTNSVNPATVTTVATINMSGEYSIVGNKVLGARITGWGSPTGTATRTTFDTTTVTLAQLAERVRALIDDGKTHGFIGA